MSKKNGQQCLFSVASAYANNCLRNFRYYTGWASTFVIQRHTGPPEQQFLATMPKFWVSIVFSEISYNYFLQSLLLFLLSGLGGLLNKGGKSEFREHTATTY